MVNSSKVTKCGRPQKYLSVRLRMRRMRMKTARVKRLANLVQPFISNNLVDNTPPLIEHVAMTTSTSISFPTVALVWWTMEIYYTCGERQNQLLVVDDYKYYRSHVSKQNIYTWRCTLKTCNAKVYTIGDIKEICKLEECVWTHNHPEENQIQRGSSKRKAVEHIEHVKPAKIPPVQSDMTVSGLGCEDFTEGSTCKSPLDQQIAEKETISEVTIKSEDPFVDCSVSLLTQDFEENYCEEAQHNDPYVHPSPVEEILEVNIKSEDPLIESPRQTPTQDLHGNNLAIPPVIPVISSQHNRISNNLAIPPVIPQMSSQRNRIGNNLAIPPVIPQMSSQYNRIGNNLAIPPVIPQISSQHNRIDNNPDMRPIQAAISFQDNAFGELKNLIREVEQRIFTRINEMEERLMKKIQAIRTQQHYENLQKNMVPSKRVLDFLPLKTSDDLDNFNILLEEDGDFRNDFVQYITRIGGGGISDQTCRILRHLISNQLATICSWLGLNGTIKLHDRTMMILIKDILLARNTELPSTYLENVCCAWLMRVR